MGVVEQVFVIQTMVVLEERVNVFQPKVVLEQLVAVLLFCFYDNRGDGKDVYTLSLFFYVHLFDDVVFVQIKKRQRIIR